MVSFDSIVRLGWAFVRVLARKLIDRRPQLPRFNTQYAADGILQFEPEDHAALQGASRCIVCARCDATAISRGVFDALDPRGPMAFVLGVSRHSGHHDRAELRAQANDELLRALTDACPVGVPFVPLVALVRRRGRALEEVRHALAPQP
jgi:hypothetical protein